MPSFSYIARNRQSSIVTGQVSSADQRSVAITLTHQGLIPIKIEPMRRHFNLRQAFERLFFSKWLFLSIFSSSFAQLLRSGLTIPQAVSVLSKQFQRSFIQRAIETLHTKLQLGLGLSAAMRQMHPLFPPYLVALCQAGEDSGCLSDVLQRAASFFDRLRTLRNKILSAMIYPLFLVAMSVVTIGLLFVLILPRVTSMYEQLHSQLPWQTEFLVSIGSLVESNSGVLLAVVGLALLTLILVSFRSHSNTAHGSLLYRVPFVGSIVMRAELADQLSVTGLLLRHGVSLPEALRATDSLTRDTAQKNEFLAAANAVESGRSLAVAIADTRRIPAFVKDMISLGEEADCLADSLESSADIVKGAVEQRLTVLTTILEPAMILFVALLVGFIVYSVLIPIFNIDILGG